MAIFLEFRRSDGKPRPPSSEIREKNANRINKISRGLIIYLKGPRI